MDTIGPRGQMRDSWEAYLDVEELSDSEEEDFVPTFDSIETLIEEEVPPGECEICLNVAFMPSRCCKSYFCDECLSTYINTKVNEGQYRIECPGSNCFTQLHYNVLEVYLSPRMHSKFVKFFTDGNSDPTTKSCPSCGTTHSIDPKELKKKNKRKLCNGLQVTCPQCQFVWCFLCQAPFHSGITCKEYRKSDCMVRKWAKEWTYGQFNAQKCPKCKIYIQKADGCDHMTCSKCKTDFCYRCGGRYIKTKYFGNHLSHLSVFGCKYRFMPDRPILRRIIRGASFAGLLTGGVILAGVGLAVGAALVGTSVVILPGYGAFRLRKHMVRKRQRKMFQAQRQAMESVYEPFSSSMSTNYMITREAAMRPIWNLENLAVADRYFTGNGCVYICNRGDRLKGCIDSPDHDYKDYINIGQQEPSEVSDEVEDEYDIPFMLRLPEDATDDSNSENYVTTTHFTEIPNGEGYTTLVANIVTRPAAAIPSPLNENEKVLDSSLDGSSGCEEDEGTTSNDLEVPTCDDSPPSLPEVARRSRSCSPSPDYDNEDDKESSPPLPEVVRRSRSYMPAPDYDNEDDKSIPLPEVVRRSRSCSPAPDYDNEDDEGKVLNVRL